MILSMTGYGAAAAQKEDHTVSVEIRTMNHRFLDIHIRLAKEYLFLENEIHQLIRGVLSRGRVEVNVVIQGADGWRFCVNTQLVKGYWEAAQRLKEEYGLQDSLDLKTLITLPGVIQLQEALVENQHGHLLSELTSSCVRTALEGVLRMRRQEGEALRADMLQNLTRMQDCIQRISALSVNLPDEHMRKLRDRVLQLLPQGALDPQRLAQEAALLADKYDISEEITRLESHFGQCRALMDGEERAGKKLEFLVQEMQREANTILAKSGNLEISQYVLALKADIEKLREQAQNVE